jgi:hypothetical protein
MLTAGRSTTVPSGRLKLKRLGKQLWFSPIALFIDIHPNSPDIYNMAKLSRSPGH